MQTLLPHFRRPLAHPFHLLAVNQRISQHLMETIYSAITIHHGQSCFRKRELPVWSPEWVWYPSVNMLCHNGNKQTQDSQHVGMTKHHMGDMKSSDTKISSDTDTHVVITPLFLTVFVSNTDVRVKMQILSDWKLWDWFGILQHWCDFTINPSNIQKQAEDKIAKFSNGYFFNDRHFKVTFTSSASPLTLSNSLYTSITDECYSHFYHTTNFSMYFKSILGNDTFNMLCLN